MRDRPFFTLLCRYAAAWKVRDRRPGRLRRLAMDSTSENLRGDGHPARHRCRPGAGSGRRVGHRSTDPRDLHGRQRQRLCARFRGRRFLRPVHGRPPARIQAQSVRRRIAQPLHRLVARHRAGRTGRRRAMGVLGLTADGRGACGRAHAGGVSARRILDGPHASGRTRAPPRDCFYWELHEGASLQAVRFGNWKAVRKGSSGPVELYDLAADPAESRDMSADRPDLVRRATELMAAAHRPDPNWLLRDPPAKRPSRPRN